MNKLHPEFPNNIKKIFGIFIMISSLLSCVSKNNSETKSNIDSSTFSLPQNQIQSTDIVTIDNPITPDSINYLKSKSKLDTNNYVDHTPTEFINHNINVSLQYSNDSLLCITTNGIKYYNSELDQWQIISYSSSKDTPFYKHLSIGKKKYEKVFPKGFAHRAYWSSIVKKKENYWLVHHTDEGRMTSDCDIIDTIGSDVYTFRHETIKDFIVDSLNLWTINNSCISKVNRSNHTRTNYITLPAFKEIVSSHKVGELIYFLDKHYGIYYYNPDDKIVRPITKLFQQYPYEKHNFINSLLIDDDLFLIINGHKGNKVVRYSLSKDEIIERKSEISYFDSFLHRNDSLVVYGEQLWISDGEEANNGGAVLYLLNNNKLTNLTNEPITKVQLNGQNIELFSIAVRDASTVCIKKLTVNKYNTLTTDYSRSYLSHPKKDVNIGDTVNHWDGESYLYYPDSLSYYYQIIETHNKERRGLPDSSLFSAPVINTDFKFKSGDVEFYNYNEEKKP